jgi:branched-chain amino acid transport system permease protein
VLGAILVTYLQIMLSDVTEIWQLYFGLMFIAVVMFAPGGIAGLLMLHAPLWRGGTLHRLVPAYLVSGAALLVAVLGAILTIELGYRLMAKASDGSQMTLWGISFDAAAVGPWLVALAMLFGGGLLFRLSWSLVAHAWSAALAAARAREVSA